ncbi:tetratricopeptide repeat protein [Anaerolinea thermolimosa]|uniref:tetratricopeptide repeat protein n=1 Tax=Anaerolinea thermolimosa TaxID=229919 RepID=UPI0013B44F88|nr:tetratricopeptide repeat protein [Anaerolinea thermolimosa]
MNGLESGLRVRAVRAYEDIRRRGEKPSDLKMAVLAALALRERRRLTGNWNGLADELITAPTGVRSLNPEIWLTPLACLAGMVGDAYDLILGLWAPKNETAGLRWMLHIYETQPADRSPVAESVKKWLRGITGAQQIEFLRLLVQRGLEEESRVLAGELLENVPLSAVEPGEQENFHFTPEALGKILLEAQRTATLHSLAGNPVQAKMMLKKATDALEVFQWGIRLQRAFLDESQNLKSGLAEQMTAIDPITVANPAVQEQFGWLLSYRNPDDLQDIGEKLAAYHDPCISVQYGWTLYQQGEKALGCEVAKPSVQKLIRSLREEETQEAGFILTWRPGTILSKLIEMGLLQEAMELGDLLLQKRPADFELILFLEKIYRDSGLLEQALRLIEIALCLAPDRIDLIRESAALYEHLGDWANAYLRRKGVLTRAKEPTLEDKILYTRDAVEVGQYDEASNLCEELLSSYPDIGEIHGILGKIRIVQGRLDEAEMHLSRATLVSPEAPEWWLALAGLYEQKGEEIAEIDTLKAGLLAASSSPELNFALGKKLLEKEQPTEALPYLRQASNLNRQSPEVQFLFSKALHALGYLQEAREVIEPLKNMWEVDPGVAYEYGCIAMDLGDARAAVPAFEIATRSPRAKADWYLKYARVLLDDHLALGNHEKNLRYQRAEELLEKAEILAPDNLVIKLAIAESIRKQGRLEDAQQLYRELIDAEDVLRSGLLGNVQHGLGMTMMAVGNMEAGVALLREASQSQPSNLTLTHDLAEACLEANLKKDAEEAAERALSLAPNDPENLDWFARMMVRLDRASRALDALKQAIMLIPGRVDLRIRYARLALESGDLESARDALQAIKEEQSSDDVELLRQAAYLSLRLQDFPAAIEYFEKAISLSSPASPELVYELAQVYEKTGQIDLATQTLEKGNQGISDPRLLVYYADLLARQNRFNGAIEAVEKAIGAINPENENEEAMLTDLYYRLAVWQRRLGNLASAFEQAEKAWVYSPKSLRNRWLLTELAYATLQDEKALELAFSLTPDDDSLLEAEAASLVGLGCHLAIEHEDLEGATRWHQLCRPAGNESLWVQSVEARLLIRQGKFRQATEIIENLVQHLIVNARPDGNLLLAVAKTAAEAYLWDSSFKLISQYLTLFPGEVRGIYEKVRISVEAVEFKSMEKELRIKAHTPFVDEKDLAFRETLENSLESLRLFLDAGRFQQLKWRISMALQPAKEVAKQAMIMPRSAGELAAVILCFRKLNCLDEALQAANLSNHSVVLFQKALVLAEKNDPGALLLAKDILAQNIGHPLVLVLVATLQERFGEVGTAIESLEEALSIWPDEEGWQAQVGWLAESMGDYSNALVHLEKAFALNPAEGKYALGLGRNHLFNGDQEKAEEILVQATRLCPDSPEAWLLLAQAQFEQGHWEGSLKNALKASEMAGGDSLALVLASRASFKLGNSSEALRLARIAYECSPHTLEAIINFSRMLGLQQELHASLAVIESALESQPACRELLLEKAQLIYQIDGPASVSEMAQRLVQAYPEDAEVLALHAMVQAELGNVQLAQQSALRSLRINPHQPRLAMKLGVLNRRTGQLDQAVHHLSQAVLMDPANVDAYLELGQVYLDRREFQKALETFQEVIRIAPRDARGYFEAGLILKEAKDYQGAEKMLQQAAKIAPDDLQIHRQLVSVMALNLIHKTQEAKTAL